MHDVLRERLWTKLESMPDAQLYQILDYIEFLESKYANRPMREPDPLSKFAERFEESMRMRSVAPKVILGTVGLMGTAQKFVRGVTDAGKDLLGALEGDPKANDSKANDSKDKPS